MFIKRIREYLGDKPASILASILLDAGWLVFKLVCLVTFLWVLGVFPLKYVPMTLGALAAIMFALLVAAMFSYEIARKRLEF